MLLYDISAFMVYFIFYFFYKLDRFLLNFLIMKSPRHVTLRILFTDPDKICTAYVKFVQHM